MKSTEKENREEFKKAMEEAVAEYEQVGDGRLCGQDAANVASLLRKEGFCKIDQVKFIPGPLTHYNYKLGGEVKARHHMVAELDFWVVDPAMKPYHRVFDSMSDYMKNSGIKKLS